MEINCRFEVFFEENTYDCYVNKANITEKDQEIKEFKGDHEEGKSHNDVTLISFVEETIVDYFPRGLQKHFPNFTELEIDSCGIKKISKNDLEGLEGLVHLRIVNCELSSLPDDLLTEMPNLEIVSFCDNKIEFASSNLLKPLIGREDVVVCLEGNKNIDACYWPGKEGSLESLEDLMKLIDEKCIKPIFVPDLVDFDQRVKEMWVSGKFSDLTIVVGEKKFKVHKTVLGMYFWFAHRFSSQLLKEKAFRLIADIIPEEVSDKLMEDPEKLKKLIDARRALDELLKDK